MLFCIRKYGLHILFLEIRQVYTFEHIHYDYRHLCTDIAAPPEITRTKDYIAHIESIQDEP